MSRIRQPIWPLEREDEITTGACLGRRDFVDNQETREIEGFKNKVLGTN